MTDPYALKLKKLVQASKDLTHELQPAIGIARVRLSDTDFDSKFGLRACRAFDAFDKALIEAEAPVQTPAPLMVAASLRALLLKLAPHVAVQSRNPVLAPENREDLAKLEPEMLRLLLATKDLE